uniref:Translocon-associated protein subunit beta n=1 Tax=Steinernema glaseri TaxID=37863 RepID=A0A1I7ZA98_9BILA
MKLLLLLFALAGIAFAQDGASKAAASTDSAHLLASKSSVEKYAVEGKDFVLQYHLRNVGDRAALRVTLDDRHSFPTEAFEIVEGSLQAEWKKIAPGAVLTHNVTVKPLTFGRYNITAAVITYYPSDEAKQARVGYTSTSGEAKQARVGYTSTSGEGYIFRQKDHERLFGSKSHIWLISALMCVPPFAFIFFSWNIEVNRYKDPIVSKKKSK